MSHEGTILVMRAGLVLFMILVTAFFRTLAGPGKKRGRIMLLGTVGGISFGVAAAYPVSQWLHSDVSPLGAILGITLGWTVSWLLFARHIPREAN